MGFRLILLALCLPATLMAGANSKRWINSAPCVQMCDVIDSCAAKQDHAELGRLLCHVAACESGKFCSKKEVRSPNGLFFGPFQFTRQTWKSVCQPVFKKKGIKNCSGKKSIFDTCCSTACASELIAEDINGGIKNWPQCGPAAKRSVASEGK